MGFKSGGLRLDGWHMGSLAGKTAIVKVMGRNGMKFSHWLLWANERWYDPSEADCVLPKLFWDYARPVSYFTIYK